MRSLLLDTHVWLWLGSSPERIESSTLRVLEDPSNSLYLSTASTWEIAIKYRLGKLPLPEPPHLFVPPRLVRDQIRVVPIEVLHTTRVATLPDHHDDPFDRMLVAQAQEEGLVLVTADRQLVPYDVAKLLA